MSTWAFVLVYLLAFALVQLAVYQYLRRRDDDEDGDGDGASAAWVSPPGAGFGATGEHLHRTGSGDPPDAQNRTDARDGSEASRAREESGVSGRRCHNCGTRNEADGTYTFCRNCVTRLSG